MTDNKLQLNEDKTEAVLFNPSELQDPPTSRSICQTTVTLSDSARNLGFYLDKDMTDMLYERKYHLQDSFL